MSDLSLRVFGSIVILVICAVDLSRRNARAREEGGDTFPVAALVFVLILLGSVLFSLLRA